uniref:SET domain-containing protein n=1 Tax=Macrostomum lignano TaxID=282301 RepID=A0A1I8JN02_9PLAT
MDISSRNRHVHCATWAVTEKCRLNYLLRFKEAEACMQQAPSLVPIWGAPAGRQSVPRRLGSAAVPVSKRCHHSAACFRPRLFSEVSALPPPTPAPRSGAVVLQQFDVVRICGTPTAADATHAEIEVAIVIGTSAFDPAPCRPGRAAVSRESSLENGELPVQLAPVAEAAQTSSAQKQNRNRNRERKSKQTRPAVVAARPVEGRRMRASPPPLPLCDAKGRRGTRRSTRTPAAPPEASTWLARSSADPGGPASLQAASSALLSQGRRPLRKKLMMKLKSLSQLCHPPPPEFQTSVEEQVASGDDEGDKEPPLDIQSGCSRVAVQPKPQERHRHNPPRVSVEPQTAPAPADAAAPPLTLRPASAAARRRQAADGNLPGRKRKRRPADAGVSGGVLSARDYSIRAAAAGFVQPLVENAINSVTLQQRVPPMASPRSASASAISGGQTLMVSSAVLPAKRGLQGRPDQLVAPDAEHRIRSGTSIRRLLQQQRHWGPRSSTWNGGKGRHDPPDKLVQFVSLKLVRQQQQLDGTTSFPTELVDGAISSIWVGIRTQEVGQRYSVAEPAIASDVGLSFAGGWVTRRLRVSSLTNAAAGVDGLEFNSRTTSGRISQQSGEQARVLSQGEHLHATDVHVQVALSPRSSQAVHQLTAVRLSSGRSQLLASQQEVQAAGAAEACRRPVPDCAAERLPAPAIDEAQEAASSRCAEPITDSNSRLAAAQASRSETAVRRRKIFASSSGGSLGKPLFGMLVNPIC